MYEISVENKYGERLQLTQTPNYITKATGLSPVNSNIITATVANYGGERYVSSRKQKRNIVLTIYPQEPVEYNRINLYKYIKSSGFIRVYFKNNTRNVYIDGYVESFEDDLFEQTQTAQVSIICPQPNFIDMASNEVGNSSITAGFYYPFNTEIVQSEGKSLSFTGLPSGEARFIDFMATPEVAMTSIGTLVNKKYVTKLTLNTTEVTIPLGEQIDGENLIKGGASLVHADNQLITYVLTDDDGSGFVDDSGSILFE